MTTPHDPQQGANVDPDDELLRAVLDEEEQARAEEHELSAPISPAARARLEAGIADAPAPEERPSIDDVYGAVDRPRRRTAAPADGSGAVIGSQPDLSPAQSSRREARTGWPQETEAPAAARRDEGPDVVVGSVRAPADPVPAVPSRRSRRDPQVSSTEAVSGSAPAADRASEEGASPWNRLQSPQTRGIPVVRPAEEGVDPRREARMRDAAARAEAARASDEEPAPAGLGEAPEGVPGDPVLDDSAAQALAADAPATRADRAGRADRPGREVEADAPASSLAERPVIPVRSARRDDELELRRGPGMALWLVLLALAVIVLIVLLIVVF